jgi:hypothetical protein
MRVVLIAASPAMATSVPAPLLGFGLPAMAAVGACRLWPPWVGCCSHPACSKESKNAEVTKCESYSEQSVS